MELIDKDKVVAEIERLIEVSKAFKKIWKWKLKWFYRTIIGRLEVLEGLKTFIDTLEVKDVDLEKEIGKYLDTNDVEFIHQIKLLDFAKHFYELGLKEAKKGE